LAELLGFLHFDFSFPLPLNETRAVEKLFFHSVSPALTHGSLKS
jgi:hypothetical protein